MKLNGIWVAVTTPFNAQEDLYPAKIRHNIACWNRTKVAGYAVGTASSGEGILLSEKEITQLWEHAAQATAPEKLLLAAAGVASIRETITRANRAAALGYHAILVETPRLSEPSAPVGGAQALFYRSVADQTKIPLVIESTPFFGGVQTIDVETACLLAEHPNIIAMSEGAAPVKKITQLIRDVPSGFQVLVASTDTLYPSLRRGAAGAILAFANSAPFLCLSIEEAVRTREYGSAQELHERASTAARVTDQYGVAGLKYAMDLQGYYGGPPRLPLVAVGPVAKLEIQKAFRGI